MHVILYHPFFSSSSKRLTLQIGSKYPYIPPTIELENIIGLSVKDQAYLTKTINQKCRALSEHGCVMVCELVQLTEDFLLIHNKDPAKAKISAWEQMKAREEKQRRQKVDIDDMSFHWSDKESPSYHQNENTLSNTEHQIDSREIQEEIERQIQALSNASEGRRRNEITQDKALSTNDEGSIESGIFSEDEDNVNFDDYSDQNLNSLSRYKSDFIERKFLGRGGGGEVVKVINKLDRRTCKF